MAVGRQCSPTTRRGCPGELAEVPAVAGDGSPMLSHALRRVPWMANFRFDDGALRRIVDEGMRKTVAPAVQRVLDDVFRTHKGNPLEEIKAVLQQRWTAGGRGWSLTDPT